MATISLQISDAALVVVTDYAASLSTTPEALIASQGVTGTVRSAYAEAVRKLTQAGNLPASVRARVAERKFRHTELPRAGRSRHSIAQRVENHRRGVQYCSPRYRYG